MNQEKNQYDKMTFNDYIMNYLTTDGTGMKVFKKQC